MTVSLMNYQLGAWMVDDKNAKCVSEFIFFLLGFLEYFIFAKFEFMFIVRFRGSVTKARHWGVTKMSMTELNEYPSTERHCCTIGVEWLN